jgi:Mrp family chromosome partitioning ATPase
MSIITIATTKGGAGKTTLARLILGRSALSGLKAAALDADFIGFRRPPRARSRFGMNWTKPRLSRWSPSCTMPTTLL